MYEFNGFPIVGKKIDENPELATVTGDEKIPLIINGITQYVKLSNISVQGIQGEQGDTGEQGNKGWSPVIGIFTASNKKVFKIVDWVGGEGAKPAFGQYIGEFGLVTNILDAVQIDYNLPLKADLVNGKVPTSQLNFKTTIPTTTPLLTINWQTATPPSEIITYATKHGNSISNITGVYFQGGVYVSYNPAFSYTVNGAGLIQVLTITDLFNGFITII